MIITGVKRRKHFILQIWIGYTFIASITVDNARDMQRRAIILEHFS